ncbi:MAG: HAD-IIB family hydrolase [Bryobacterales bacterium]|nr:HAD-IIB family hydrolase [Bryobacterales bacterium]
MWIVATDLDGTLLNHHDYSWAGARKALDALETRGVPVVFCTSKTRAEVDQLRSETGNRHPFITENGGAVYLPVGAFRALSGQFPEKDGYLLIALGREYQTLVAALAEAAEESGCTVRGFAGASDSEVAVWCEFSEAEAALARQREFDEPFLLEDGDGESLAAAIRRRGFCSVRGGRFWHILGNNDKGAALCALRRAYLGCGVPVSVAALGDSPNDLPLLAQAEWPVVMPSPRLAEMLESLPHARVAPMAGSAGWGASMLDAIPAWFRGLEQSDYPLRHFSF